MIFYDSDPPYSTHPLAKYEGQPHDKDNSTFRSFKVAKRAALDRVRRELRYLMEQERELEAMTVDTCPTERNPFA